MSTKPPSRTAEQFVVRLPDGMRDRIAEEAKRSGRSMNAEIVQRLEWALQLSDAPKFEKREPLQQPIAGALSWYITDEIKALADREGVPFDEMFAKIVVAGLHPEAPQVLYVPVLAGASKEDLRRAMQASEGIARPDAAIVLDALERAPWAPEWMMERLAAAASAASEKPTLHHEPPQAQPNNLGQKALVISGVQSGKTLNSLDPLIKDSTTKAKKQSPK